MQRKIGKNLFLDDFEGVFEKKMSRFIWARCHIKLNHAIYLHVYPIHVYDFVCPMHVSSQGNMCQFICLCLQTCVSVCVSLCIYLCVSSCASVCVSLCVRTCVSICMEVLVSMYVYLCELVCHPKSQSCERVLSCIVVKTQHNSTHLN